MSCKICHYMQKPVVSARSFKHQCLKLSHAAGTDEFKGPFEAMGCHSGLCLNLV